MLSGKLKHLFPDWTSKDWELHNRGDGSATYIRKWNRQEPQPTQAELDAVTDAQAKAALEAEDFKHDFDGTKRDKALLRLIADLHGIPFGQLQSQLRSIWKGL